MGPKKNTRMEKYRMKIKSDPEKWEEHLQKERQCDKMRRQKSKEKIWNNERVIEENRRKIRERVKKHGSNLKTSKANTLEQHQLPIGTFKCCQSFGKTLNRVKQSLPKSPGKKTAVIKKLVADVIGPDVLLTSVKVSKLTWTRGSGCSRGNCEVVCMDWSKIKKDSHTYRWEVP